MPTDSTPKKQMQYPHMHKTATMLRKAGSRLSKPFREVAAAETRRRDEAYEQMLLQRREHTHVTLPSIPTIVSVAGIGVFGIGLVDIFSLGLSDKHALGYQNAYCDSLLVCPKSPDFSSKLLASIYTFNPNNLLNPSFWANIPGYLSNTFSLANPLDLPNYGYAAMFVGTFMIVSSLLYNMKKEAGHKQSTRQTVYTGVKSFFLSIPFFFTEISLMLGAAELSLRSSKALEEEHLALGVVALSIASLMLYGWTRKEPVPVQTPLPNDVRAAYKLLGLTRTASKEEVEKAWISFKNVIDLKNQPPIRKDAATVLARRVDNAYIRLMFWKGWISEEVSTAYGILGLPITASKEEIEYAWSSQKSVLNLENQPQVLRYEANRIASRIDNAHKRINDWKRPQVDSKQRP